MSHRKRRQGPAPTLSEEQLRRSKAAEEKLMEALDESLSKMTDEQIAQAAAETKRLMHTWGYDRNRRRRQQERGDGR